MRILAYLIHTFLDPLGIGLGILAGLVARRMWQAGWGGAAAGAIAVAIIAHLHDGAVPMRPTVTAAIVSGLWGIAAFWLRRWLRISR